MTGPSRRTVPWLCFGVATVGFAWALWLTVHGGFDAVIGGVKITTNEPLRPLVGALVLLWLFVALSRDEHVAPDAHRLVSTARGLMARLDDRWLAMAIAVSIVFVGWHWGTHVAGASDPYGYVSEADLFAHGRLEIPQPWANVVPWPNAKYTLSPLGYHPRTTSPTLTPSYSAGLPILMAVAQRLVGPCGVYWIVPLSGGILVLATFGLGRALGSSRAGLAAAWLVATSPVLLFMLLLPMSDVPAAAAWAVAFWSLTLRGARRAAVSGAATACALLVRPNLAPMALLPLAWLAVQIWRGGRADRRRRAIAAIAFALALAPGIAAIAALNVFWYGSPLSSGYGSVGDIFSAASFTGNVRHYARWFADTQSPLAFLGIAVLLVPWRRLWPADRSLPVVYGLFVVAVWIEYCAYLSFDSWWTLRFLLPVWPFVMTGLAFALRLAVGVGPRRPLAALACAMGVLLLGIHGLRFAQREQVFGLHDAEARYQVVAELVARVTPADAVVFSANHSGSIRYYAGRLTLFFPSLDQGWLDHAADWLATRGAHPYAVLDGAEVAQFRTQFAGMRLVDRLDEPPLAVHHGANTVYLIDLGPDVAAPAATIHIASTETHCVMPGPLPIPAFAKRPEPGGKAAR